MDLFTATEPLRRRPLIGYLLAIVGPCLGLAVRLAIGDSFQGFPFITFFPVIFVVSYLGGWGAGVVTTLLSAAMASYFLIAPIYSFRPGPSEVAGLAFFALASSVIIALTQSMLTARARLAEANDALEQRVAARTRELVETNEALRQETATRQAAEAQVRQVQKMEAIGQLTGGIAHDFNNMLAIVIGSVDMARRRLARGDIAIGKYLDGALEGANRGAALTRRLLAFSRQQALEPAVIDLNTLVQDMAELLRRTIGEQIELESVLGGGLWRARVDPGQLESAILNLAVNARDAMPGGGRLTIETLNASLDDDYAAHHGDVTAGQYVMVAVSDTGAGMSADVMARAFDPFFTTKPVDRGTGLGLSQVYGFVKQSGGHVKIYSEPGQGTVVKIYLPRETAKPATAEAPARPVVAALPQGHPDEIILVVEDEERVRRTTVEALRDLGYTVRHAGSADEARSMLHIQPGVRLLFTDVVMPGKTGRQLVDEVKPGRPDLKVLYTTGYTRNAIVHNGVVDPGVDLLMKPFAIDQLARKVRSVLDSGKSP
ncbi:MAG: hybrid sensor histidine kinase/response regulator [Reyranella sp.]|nr:hybrid sensor histidine kinase/response regulator [Reyranella sp.]